MPIYYKLKEMSTDSKAKFVHNKYQWHKKNLKLKVKKYGLKKPPSKTWLEEEATMRTIIDIDRARLKGHKPGTKKQWKY